MNSTIEPPTILPVPTRPICITSALSADVELILPLAGGTRSHTVTVAWNRRDDLGATAVLIEPVEIQHDAYLALVVAAGTFCQQRGVQLADSDPHWARLWRDAHQRLVVYYNEYTAARHEDEAPLVQPADAALCGCAPAC